MLPIEILYLFSAKIEEPGTLFSLTLVSKNCYDVFNHHLYKFMCAHCFICPSQIRTLALSPNERMPLIGPHPASFVKRLILKFIQTTSDLDEENEEESEEDLFRRQVILALNNIAEYAVLCCLDLCFPEVPLDKGIKSQNPIVFGHLREIVIECPIPNERSLEIFVSF